jgi:uncharacterized membrane protein YphA (DoxX/SURF4 family)
MEFPYFLSLQLLTLAFLAVLFLQSGLDKVFNYKGNFEWLQSHFEKSPLRSMVGIMMPVITILEVSAGICCAVGIFSLLFGGGQMMGLLGSQLSALSILALFFGQRLAQDYPGAATLTTYFLISLLGIYLMGA